MLLISRKLTFDGFAPIIGFICFFPGLLAAILCLATLHFIAFLIAFGFVILGCFGILAFESIEYDTTTKCFRLCKSNYVIKRGEWYSLALFEAVQIRYFIDAPVYYPKVNKTEQNRRFSVFLVAIGGDDLKINDFSIPENATEFMHQVSDIFQIPIMESIRMHD